MHKLNIIITACIILFMTVSCNNKTGSNRDENRIPLVSAYDQTFYKDQLDKAIPYNLPKEDSITFAEQYIQKWIDDVLAYEKAKRNIIDNESIDELVRDYRKSLIIHSYQNDLLNDKFEEADALSDKKLEDFYTANKDRFKLREPIIKGLYLKIPVKASQLANFRKWYSQGNDEAIENIEKNALQNTVGYDYFYNKWLTFNEVFSTIPKQVDNKDQFLKNNKTVEVQDSSFVYLVHIKEYMLEGEDAPFEYVKDELSLIIREKERAEYLKQIQKDLYQKALSDKEIIFYNK